MISGSRYARSGRTRSATTWSGGIRSLKERMIEVLHVYTDVGIVNARLVEGALKEPYTVTISYDEKPGIQALATTAARAATRTESVPKPLSYRGSLDK